VITSCFGDKKLMGTRLHTLDLLTLLFAISLSGCGTQARSSGRATLGVATSASAWSREVKWSVDGTASMEAKANEGFTIRFSGGKIFVDKERVLLNGNEVAKVSEGAKVVDVDYTGRILTIRADGAKVYEADLGK
jgi:hypothetical protein